MAVTFPTKSWSCGGTDATFSVKSIGGDLSVEMSLAGAAVAAHGGLLVRADRRHAVVVSPDC
jgi:hypothetical protein